MMIAHFQELKGQMNKLREAEHDRLTKLTLESNASIKELKRKVDKVNLQFSQSPRKINRCSANCISFACTCM